MTIVIMEGEELEEHIRKVIREELLAFTGRIATYDGESRSDFPVTLTVKEAAKVLRMGVTKTYNLTRRKGFPAIRDGWKIRIPRDELFRWANQQAMQNPGAPCEK